MLAELQLEADGWAQARQQCAECKELLTAAVVTAADVHKRSLDAASAATVKYSPWPLLLLQFALTLVSPLSSQIHN